MPKTRLISPGSIPNHKLLKNLQLQGNYISNDGGDEGITVDDDGIVTTSALTINNVTENIQPVLIDYDFTNTTGSVQTGFRIDVDRTGDVSSGIDVNYGQFTTVNTTGASGGTITSYGHRIGVTGDSGGTSKTIGLHITVGSAATNYAMITSGGNVGIGEFAPQDTLEVNGTILVKDKLKFIQDDGDEYITSLNDGYLDLDATTAIRFRQDTFFTGKIYFAQTDGNEYIDSLNDGYLDIDATTAIRLKADTLIAGTSKLYFNDEGGEYISGDGTDMTITSGSNLNIDASGHVEFDGCGVGFDKETAVFSTSPIDSDANDSTDVDFRLGNKFELTLTDDISGSSEFINLIFPATSGNFILVLIQGVADCTVANAGWIAYQSDGSTKALNDAGNPQADGRVRWAGGTAPTLSTAQYDVDIISFYWDADNETAFAVASLDF